MVGGKTDVVVVSPDGQEPSAMIDIKLGEEKLKVVKSKTILGVIIDNQLNFHEQIQERVRAGFRALKSLDTFVKEHKGCCQSVYLRLYNALVLPVMDYGAPMATSKCITEMGKVHRATMSLRERLRTHKVSTKDQRFYLNYNKFSIKSYVLNVY